MLLAFASFMGIKLYKMDVKCVFLNGQEAYLKQPLVWETHTFLIIFSGYTKPYVNCNKLLEHDMRCLANSYLKMISIKDQ